MKPSTALDTHELVTKIASYLDVLGGIIIIVFAITAVFSLPALLFGTMPSYNLSYTMTPASGSTPASTMLICSIAWNTITGALITGLSNTGIGFGFSITSVGGISMTTPVSTIINLTSSQFGSGGMTLVGIALILGFLGMVAGFVSRKNPRIGGAIAFIVIIALLFVGFTNLGMIDASIGMIGIVPLLGIGIIGVGGVLGLAISEL